MNHDSFQNILTLFELLRYLPIYYRHEGTPNFRNIVSENILNNCKLSKTKGKIIN